MSRHSTTPAWNWCGNVNIASAPRPISAAKPLVSSPIITSGASGSVKTRLPSASIAASLNTDSNAIASTRPRLWATADARRVPNSIANHAITKATQSALSRHAGAPTVPDVTAP